MNNVGGGVPEDGIYFRAPGVTNKLRSFPPGGPQNCYKDHFKVPDAGTQRVPLRSVVPPEQKNWDVPFPEYISQEYMTELVLTNSRNRNPNGWADPEPGIAEDDPEYGKYFKKYNPIWLRGISRDSGGRLLHPYGRAGLRGQGVLGNRHVNEAIDPITVYLDPRLGVLKVLLIKRNPVDTEDNDWAIPGGMVDYKNETDSYTVPMRLNALLSKFDVKAPTLMKDTQRELRDNALRELKEETGFSGNVSYQKLIAQMYSDDVRTTDSAWICTSVFLLVTDSNESVSPDGVETAEARWVPFRYAINELDFFASHRAILDAAIRYYVTNSFADRNLSGSPSHRQAFAYLKDVTTLELPNTFDELMNAFPDNLNCQGKRYHHVAEPK
eukprot:gene4427-8815_t